MKKIFSTLLVAIIATLLLTACVSDFEKGQKMHEDAYDQAFEIIAFVANNPEQINEDLKRTATQDINNIYENLLRELNSLNLSASEKERLLSAYDYSFADSLEQLSFAFEQNN